MSETAVSESTPSAALPTPAVNSVSSRVQSASVDLAPGVTTWAVVAVGYLLVVGLVAAVIQGVFVEVVGPANRATAWEFVERHPALATALGFALATLLAIPPSFALLSHRAFFQARRGRVLQRPAFFSIVMGMVLCMGVPAIFAAIALKSLTFDINRYEFDPSRAFGVLDQGRSFRDLREADQAIKQERQRLEALRTELIAAVKEFDEKFKLIHNLARSSAEVAKVVNPALEAQGKMRRLIGLDAPLQTIDLRGLPEGLPGASPLVVMGSVPAISNAPAAALQTTSTVASSTGFGLSEAERQSELAALPEAQRHLAAMLPLTNLPEGWEVADLGGHKVETFSVENLYEKINGRAPSFEAFGVKGMAYCSFRRLGDPDGNDVQVYLFEMGNPLKALGKYGTEKPEGVETVAGLGSEGYLVSGSARFHAGPYYTLIDSTSADPEFEAFVTQLGRRIAAVQLGQPEPLPPPKPTVAATSSPPAETAMTQATPATPPAAVVGEGAGEAAAIPATPEAIFALLPAEPGRERPQYVAEDVFGYGFLSDVFLADYKEGETTFQGFLKPCASPEAARSLLETYREETARNGAVNTEESVEELPGVTVLLVSDQADIGLIDVVFVKGNTFGGVNGASDRAAALTFARELAAGLPSRLPDLSSP